MNGAAKHRKSNSSRRNTKNMQKRMCHLRQPPPSSHIECAYAPKSTKMVSHLSHSIANKSSFHLRHLSVCVCGGAEVTNFQFRSLHNFTLFFFFFAFFGERPTNGVCDVKHVIPSGVVRGLWCNATAKERKENYTRMRCAVCVCKWCACYFHFFSTSIFFSSSAISIESRTHFYRASMRARMSRLLPRQNGLSMCFDPNVVEQFTVLFHHTWPLCGVCCGPILNQPLPISVSFLLLSSLAANQ